jgi:hypothetical protein
MKIKKGDIFSFNKLPDWAKYDAIYFIVREVKKENDSTEMDLIVIVELNNYMIKGDETGMELTEDDIKIFDPYIITDEAKIAKLLLME